MSNVSIPSFERLETKMVRSDQLKSIDYGALENYLPFRGKNYQAPEKAGEQAEEMEQFKEKGRKARTAFQQIAKLVAAKFEQMEPQRVSSWMNQAQMGTPLFFCYFFFHHAAKHEPTFAIRLLDEKGEAGLSVELSFVERYATDQSPRLQNQVLAVPLEDPVYYALRGADLTQNISSGEANKQELEEKIKNGTIRKVLVKVDIPKIKRFDDPNDLVNEILTGFEYLQPYYRETQKRLD